MDDNQQNPAPEAPKPADPAPEAPAPEQPADEGKGGKDAVLADLAKERDRRQALEQKLADAQTAQQGQLDAIAKALGLKADETPDPAKLAEQLASEQTATKEVRTSLSAAERDLAVYRAAAANNGNAGALLDSVSFRDSLKDIDASDGEAVAAAIKAAVEKNPAFAAVAPRPNGPRPDSSQGFQGAPASLEARIAEAEANGNTREVIRLKARKGMSTN